MCVYAFLIHSICACECVGAFIACVKERIHLCVQVCVLKACLCVCVCKQWLQSLHRLSLSLSENKRIDTFDNLIPQQRCKHRAEICISNRPSRVKHIGKHSVWRCAAAALLLRCCCPYHLLSSHSLQVGRQRFPV